MPEESRYAAWLTTLAGPPHRVVALVSVVVLALALPVLFSQAGSGAAPASIAIGVLTALAVGLVATRRLAGAQPPIAPLRVRAHARQAYRLVPHPADPDRPGVARPRAPGRQCR